MNKLTRWQKVRLWWARYNSSPITLHATDGTPVDCHRDFARSYWHAPDLWQDAVDEQAERQL
jgi:hypothetical protein